MRRHQTRKGPSSIQEQALVRRTHDTPLTHALPVLLAILITGCSRSHDTAPSAPDHTLRVVATDNGLQFPERHAAGMTHVVFVNQGSTIHEAMFIKLPEGMTGDDYLEAVRLGSSFPEGALDYSGPGLTSPGETVEAWLHLDPGNYLLGCWFQDHLTSLPAQTFTVHEGESGGATPPKENATVRLLDFRIEIEGRLHRGTQTLKVETPGPSMHEVDIFRLKEGRTISDLKQWQKQGKAGAAPAVAIGGALDSHDLRRVIWLRTVFRPGRHVLWCNMAMAPDAEGPAGEVTHADAGMFKEFVIE
jgi:hypothetical protein